MMTETEIRLKGYQALLNSLGVVQAEQFISLIIREPFDYTEWQKTLWPEKSIQEISQAAMLNEKNKNEG
jgi:hypothetical protein